MAYDRFDSRQGREQGSRWRDDDRGGNRNPENRGFFERAGDEIASWFGDDDAERRRRQDSQERGEDRGGRDNRDRGDYRSEYRSNQPYGQADYGRDQDRNRGDLGSDRNRWDRDQDRDDNRSTGWFDSGQSYARSMSDDYGRSSSSNRSDWDRNRSDQNRSDYGRSSQNYGSQSSNRSSGYDRSGNDDRSTDYRPMTGDYGRSSGMGSQDFSREQYGRQERFQDSDRNRGVGAGSTLYGQGNDQSRFSGHHSDPHYNEWRNRQMQELDNDYHDYRRENQNKFESEFTGWRTSRQGKRQLLQQIREHMAVVGSDGEHVGTVDKVRGDKVILTKNDSSDQHHHSLNCSLIDSIDNDQVKLSQPAQQAKQQLQREDDNQQQNSGGSALFGQRDESQTRNFDRSTNRDQDGPHMLDRSFSGTYGNNGE
ncbi:DUF2171 domain-containing protein [Sphingomonas ginkgonis]|uniref:DUF2171 domain-containing protein n=1 Tax=Sphingomonas ginkgonis TaxID=2315330 RepID=A0A429VBN6_9SPHN|nr:DUF2171 domain-containing protein [Sphingomonas ginkgonis]RST31400.1 DUF2171 domain-containing protein [Sphingomonas ginkgonis]